ncbi:MAG TPA: sigma-70 family RNA polymerase sigma factor [Bacteroidetes bacterium]|nr:sigma-70 family RNA polymerase sigma factor [Bacteroidota bacterium]
MGQLHYRPERQFDFFLGQLKKQSPREWTWLIGQFRNRLLPVLLSRAKNIHSTALMSQAEFAEEVFEECLLKFYELFEERVFEKYSDLEATIVRISDFKIKEGFAKIKRDQRLYFMNAEALSAMREKHLKKQDDQEKEKVELISEIHQHLSTLPPEDSNLILRYFNGEDLKDLAGEYNISPAACRKRKQRIIEKLKNLVIN